MTTNPNEMPDDPFTVDGFSRSERDRGSSAHLTWFRSLKPGDDVYYDVGARGRVPKFTKVKSITPTGMVRTEDDALFDQRGNLRGHLFRKLLPITDEMRRFVARRALVMELEKINWKTVSDEGLRKIAQLSVEYALPEYAGKVIARG